MKLTLGFIGAGQFGCNVCEVAEANNYRTCIINTSDEDLRSARLVTSKYLLGTKGGAGKNRDSVKADLKANYKEVLEFTHRKFDFDGKEDIIYVVFSAGGGTGSGMGPLLIDLLRRTYPNQVFGAITVLPAENETLSAQYNSLECLAELDRLQVPTIVLDNNKHDITKNKRAVYDTINQNSIEDIMTFAKTNRMASKYGNLDKADVLSILTEPGVTSFATVKLVDDRDIPVYKRIINKFNDSDNMSLSMDGIIKKAGFIFEMEKKGGDETSLIQNELFKEIGTPFDYYEGIYAADEISGDQVHVVLSGLSYNNERVNSMKSILSKQQGKVGASGSGADFSLEGASWFKDKRTSKAEDTPKPVEEDNIDDIFGAY